MPVVRVLGETLRAVPPIEKGDGSPVTAADYAVQAIVVAGLRARLGGRVPLVGEEHADALVAARRPDAERLVVDTVRSVLGWMPHADALRAIDGDEPRPGEPAWTIDPIDGTKGFLLGAQCSICLARIEGRVVTHGVLGCPRMGSGGDFGIHLSGPGLVYGASLGGGAFEWRAGCAPAPLRRGPGDAVLRWARSLNRSGNAVPSRLEPLIGAGGPYTTVSMDSQCKYALVARGDSDLVVRLPRGSGHRESVWDHASGTLIAAEAGALVSDALGQELDFSHGSELAANLGVLCVAPLHAGRVAPAIRSLAAAVAG
jgi:3'(2'), 5'-bisphosphate nucleotidase